jgi:1,2-phenylacetyl-CoA epoxidase PaaB subunit
VRTGGGEPNVYEAFAQFGEGKPISYIGSVRAGDPALAWHAAKEAYTRRENCTLLWVVPRAAMTVSTPEDATVLSIGTRMTYRVPTYPSGARRQRDRIAEWEPEATAVTQ